jgi:CNT family concentrative nucleoside transporter
MLGERLVSLLGLAVILGLSWLLSRDRFNLKMRPILGGLALQLVLALFVLRTSVGQQLFAGIGSIFSQLLDCVQEGSSFVFGEAYTEHFFAFKVLPTIIFFSALTSVLYYCRVLQPIVWACGWVMQRTLGVSGPESLATAANIFVGHTEAPLVVRPYLSKLTPSELMAVSVGGFATVSGGILAAYVEMGIDAGHLVCASVISAPAALAVAKILQPETQKVNQESELISWTPTEGNVIEAAAKGASDGVKLALNVGGMLIAFIGLIALVNLLLGTLGTQVGLSDLSLEMLLGYAFCPMAWLMGIPLADCLVAGELLGLKMVTNELIAYERLATYLSTDQGVELQARTTLILTYALCGFANFGAIAIQIAGIGGLAPERRSDIARIGFRAMLGGTLACLMTGCIAGLVA